MSNQLSGQELKAFRQFLGWATGSHVTQKDMAEMLGVSPRFYKYAEAGKKQISKNKLKAILRRNFGQFQSQPGSPFQGVFRKDDTSVVFEGHGEPDASVNSLKTNIKIRQGEPKNEGLRPVWCQGLRATFQAAVGVVSHMGFISLCDRCTRQSQCERYRKDVVKKRNALE